VTTYGLTTEGFIPKTIDVLRAEGESRLRARFGQSIDMTDP
jgi:hypothetical protein